MPCQDSNVPLSIEVKVPECVEYISRGRNGKTIAPPQSGVNERKAVAIPAQVHPSHRRGDEHGLVLV